MSAAITIYHNRECAICFTDYETDRTNDCLLTKCGHVFHNSCLEKWLRVRASCPMCKSRTFTPYLLKNIVTEAIQNGIKGGKKAAKRVVAIIALIFMYGIFTKIVEHLFFTPAQLEARARDMDAHIEKYGVIFDFGKSEGLKRLGFTILIILGTACVYSTLKSLNRRRIHHLESAERIKYIPFQ